MIQLERAGRPAIVLATDDFESLARSDAARQGLDGARIVSVAHPVGGISPAELEARAVSVVDALIARLGGEG